MPNVRQIRRQRTIFKNSQVLVDMKYHQPEFQRENSEKGLFLHVESSRALVGHRGQAEGHHVLLEWAKLLKKGFQCGFDSYE